MMSILEFYDLKYTYDGKQNVLREISGKMEQGKLYAILGPSGCGKTTLLALLGGLDSPAGGNILFAGKDIAETGLADHRRNHVSFIFQAYNLIDYLTPTENVSLTSKLPPLPILERLGLTKEESKRNVLKLSGGQQQRVAIARASGKRGPGDPGRRTYGQSGRGHRPGHHGNSQRERPQDEQVCGGRYPLQRTREAGRCGVPAKGRISVAKGTASAACRRSRGLKPSLFELLRKALCAKNTNPCNIAASPHCYRDFLCGDALRFMGVLGGSVVFSFLKQFYIAFAFRKLSFKALTVPVIICSSLWLQSETSSKNSR